MILKALKDEKASTQQDHKGLNILMHSADRGLYKCVLKGLENVTARNQLTRDGCDISDFIGNFSDELIEIYYDYNDEDRENNIQQIPYSCDDECYDIYY